MGAAASALTGNGADELKVFATSYSLPVGGGTFAFNGGAGTDKISADANVSFNLSDTSLGIAGDGAIRGESRGHSTRDRQEH